MFYFDKVKRLCFLYIYEFILISLCIVLTVNAGSCPTVCRCLTVAKNVHCSRKNLPFIPNGIPADTVQLNLKDNNFQNPTLTKSNFSRFPYLQHLYLESCGIEYISVDTFSNLKQLKFLDVSKNRLKIIDDFTFRGLTLEYLFLNDNPGMQISKNAFGGLQTKGLYIHNCAISNISIEVVRPLNSTIKTLSLDGNKLDRFDKQWIYFFNTLAHLRLGGNPLHCNCEARWLYEFYQSHLPMFSGMDPPSCRTPPRYRGQMFNSLTEDDFLCQLPILKHVDIIFEEAVGKLTCLASGDPVPTIYWVKPDHTFKAFPPRKKDNIEDNEGVLYLPDPQSHDQVEYQCVASNPAGNVTLSVNVVWPPSFKGQIVKDSGIVDSEPLPTPELVTKPVKVEKVDKFEKEKDAKKKKEYVINAVKPSKSISKASTSGSSSRQEQVKQPEVTFSIVDIVGAVVGTFLLTLLACVVIFHLFYRHQERMNARLCRNQNGINESRASNNHGHLEKSENSKMLHNNYKEGIKI